MTIARREGRRCRDWEQRRLMLDQACVLGNFEPGAALTILATIALSEAVRSSATTGCDKISMAESHGATAPHGIVTDRALLHRTNSISLSQSSSRHVNPSPKDELSKLKNW